MQNEGWPWQVLLTTSERSPNTTWRHWMCHSAKLLTHHHHHSLALTFKWPAPTGPAGGDSSPFSLKFMAPLEWKHSQVRFSKTALHYTETKENIKGDFVCPHDKTSHLSVGRQHHRGMIMYHFWVALSDLMFEPNFSPAKIKSWLGWWEVKVKCIKFCNNGGWM